MMPTKLPMAAKMPESRSVASLKWEGTPRHCCSAIKDTSKTLAVPRAAERIHAARLRAGRSPITHASEGSMTAKEALKAIGFRHDTGPSHGPP